MKNYQKLATGLMLAAVTWVASGTRVMAGEGGVSGSIAINFETVTTGGILGLVSTLGPFTFGNPPVTIPQTTIITPVTPIPGLTSVPYTGPVTAGNTTNIPGTGTTTNKVRRLSSSISVGKNGAASTARTNATDTFTSAIGGAGTLTVTNANQASAGYALGADANLGIAQANTFGGNTSTITVAPVNGNDTVTVIP
jgi:hypothetical protein